LKIYNDIGKIKDMLKITGLSYSDKEVQLNNVNLEVAKGDFYIICGPDDSGKTEILNAIMGINVPTAGQIVYKEDDIKRLPLSKRRTIRFVPDEILMEKQMTGAQYFSSIQRRYGAKDDIGIEQLLKYFNVNARELLMEMTFEANKMIYILGALMTAPELLILDEPSNFLTEATMIKLLKLLQKLNACGMTILIATESYEQAKECCNKYMYIKDGEVVSVSEAPKQVEIYRSVVVRGGNTRLLDGMFGEPASVDGEKRTYVTKRSLPQIGIIIDKSGLKEKDVHIGTVSMEEMIEMGYLVSNKE